MKKVNKHAQLPTLEIKLNSLENNVSLLALEECQDAMRQAKKRDLLKMRDKLKKMEMNLLFMLEEEKLDIHLAEAISDFLIELTETINKTNKIY